ncbi:hypothetical protein [Stenotrophomonas sp.]|uniref:hypothetical protein n=1 Tax=Stenotrophomonas sp. TaxID=69392 RepID=UPI002897F74B|nr:hypothetical protein [Stenotrophomonas sp.]
MIEAVTHDPNWDSALGATYFFELELERRSSARFCLSASNVLLAKSRNDFCSDSVSIRDTSDGLPGSNAENLPPPIFGAFVISHSQSECAVGNTLRKSDFEGMQESRTA